MGNGGRDIPQIVEMTRREIDEFFGTVNFGHLGCSRRDRPYVIPIHFARDGEHFYFFTTEGLKTEILAENPAVCLQAEDIEDNRNWRSVIVNGTAERLSGEEDFRRAKELLSTVNPGLTPAWSIRWMDMWVRENIEAAFRITPSEMSGRRAHAR